MSLRSERLGELAEAYTQSLIHPVGTALRDLADDDVHKALARAKMAGVSDREAMAVLGGSRDWKRYKKMKDAAAFYKDKIYNEGDTTP